MSPENALFTLQREAARTPFKAELGGDVLSFAHVSDIDQFAFAELLAGEPGDLEFITGTFRLALSDGDFAKLRAAKLSRGDLSRLFSAYKKHSGVDEGESAASSD